MAVGSCNNSQQSTDSSQHSVGAVDGAGPPSTANSQQSLVISH
ncbi:hypothetical protein [Microcoleus sp.]